MKNDFLDTGKDLLKVAAGVAIIGAAFQFFNR